MSRALSGIRHAASILTLAAGLYRELALSAAELLPTPRRRIRTGGGVSSPAAAPARG